MQAREYVPNVAEPLLPSTLSRVSTPPLRPEDAVGRVVLFGHTWCRNRTTKNVTAAKLYQDHVRKERTAFNAYNKKMKNAPGKKKKNLNLRKVNKVKLFSELSKAEQAIFEQRANEEIPYTYFVIAKCTRVSVPNRASSSSSVERGSSRKSNLLTIGGLNLTRIKPGDTGAILTIFDASKQTLEHANEYQQQHPHEQVRKVLEVSWNCLLTNAWFMSEHDVAVSECMNPLPRFCCNTECKTPEETLTYCDGAIFPGRGPTVFPCNRNLICLECRKGRCYREEKTDIWHCPQCQKNPRTFEGLYGYITPPRDNPRCTAVSFPIRNPITGTRTQGLLPVRSPGAPVLTFGTQHNPARDYVMFLQRRDNVPPPSYVETIQKKAADALLDTFADAGLSAGQMACMVKGLKKMNESGLIQTEVPIFAKLETLKKRSRREDGAVFGSIPETHFIDMSALGQGETEVAVNHLCPLLTFQRLLLKPTIPVKALYIGEGEVLTHQDGEPAVGGEFCQNLFFRTRCKDFPLANTKVLVISSSDKMIASGQTSYPLYFRNGNVDQAFATEATTLACFLPVIPVRLPHGGKAERRTREQTETFNQISNDSVAIVLRKFEEANLQGGAMMLYPDGVLRKTNFILASLAEDMEGKFDKSLISVNSCPRCWNRNKHYGSWLPMHACGCSPLGRRLPEQTFQVLFACYMNQAVKGCNGETDARAAELGMKHYKVVNQLLAFSTLFGKGGVHSVMNYDDLHMLYLGLFVLILSGADILFRKCFKETEYMTSYEDAHNKVEALLSYLPGMNDGLHVLKPMRLGWYRQKSWNGVAYQSFLQHLLFVFGTHDSLIKDETIRTAFISVIKKTHSLYVRVKVKTSWREWEVKQLRDDIHTIVWDLQRLFNTEVDLNVDERSAESTFFFIGPLPEKKKKQTEIESNVQNARSSRKSAKRTKKAAEEGSDSGSDSEADPEADISQDESVDLDSVSEIDDSATITLKGNQTKIPKIHALGYLPYCIECHGSHNIGSTGLYECKHRPVKLRIRHNNRNQTKSQQGQILLSSVTEACETVSNAVKSDRARLFYEENISGANGTSRAHEISEDDSSEDDGAKPFIHVGAGTVPSFLDSHLHSTRYKITVSNI